MRRRKLIREADFANAHILYFKLKDFHECHKAVLEGKYGCAKCEAVPRIVEIQRAKGQDAHFLDMHAAIGFDDLADTVHPNDAGYAKMASAWLGAFTNLFPKAQRH